MLDRPDMRARAFRRSDDSPAGEECGLYAPSPSNLLPRVREALAAPIVDHQSSPYSAGLVAITRHLKALAGLDSGDIFIIPASGTGGIECAALNMSAPGDRVVVCVNGQFGARIAHMLGALGRNVDVLKAEWGQPISASMLEQMSRSTAACFAVHVESSTGIVNPLDEISQVCMDRGVPLVVDAMASWGSLPLDLSKRKIACAIASSQKGLHAPQGLALIAIGPEGWAARRRVGRANSLYMDWQEFRKAFEHDPPQSPWTPATHLMNALRVSLELISKSGVQAWFDLRRELISATRDAIARAGYVCVGSPDSISPVIVAHPPEGFSSAIVLSRLRDMNIVVGCGQGPLKDKVVRVGTYGIYTRRDVDRIATALRAAVDPP